jgi:ABC-2 type transport system ATP-binding protein
MGMKESDSTDTGIVIGGACLQKDEKEYKKKIAYVFSELPFMEKISAVSIGKYYGRYYDGFNQKKYEALLKQYGLIDFPGVPLRISKSKKDIMNASDFSQGQKILLQLAFAQSYDAQVYFFDEPTGNLDVEFRDKFYETIRELAADENKCIIYATHLVEELEHFADYILWLQKKDNTTSKFYYGSLDELRDSYRLVSGDKTLLERIPKELVVGGRLSESSNELLIRYDETKITAKINHEIRQHMRYAELKEIMYYVQKKEIIKESGDE